MKIVVLTNIYSENSVKIIEAVVKCNNDTKILLYNNLTKKKASKIISGIPFFQLFVVAKRYMGTKLRNVVLHFFGNRAIFEPKNALEYVKLNKINYNILTDVNSNESIAILKSVNPDFLLLSSLSAILNKSALAVPKICTLNIHTSLLPAYKGPRPVFWSLLHGEDKFGFTVHEVTEKIDTGNILYQQECNIMNSKKEFEINKKIFFDASQIIMRILEDRFNSNNKHIAPFYNESYYSFPTKKDIDNFIKMGFGF